MSHRKTSAPVTRAALPRRRFLGGAGLTAAGFTIVPRHVLGAFQGAPAPSDKLNIAGIGVSGMGKDNIGRCVSETIVALCDVDFELSKRSSRSTRRRRRTGTTASCSTRCRRSTPW